MRAREEVSRTYEQLQQYAERNMMLAPDYATTIIKKFAHWFSMHEIHLVLQAAPEVWSRHLWRV